MSEILFFIIAFCACAFALLAVMSRDIFHCAVWLASALLSIAGIYFYLQAEFLGVVQVLVYVGGIITLFVFAIKLTARIGEKGIRQVNEQVILSGMVSLIFFFLLFSIIGSNPWSIGYSDKVLALPELGRSLVTVYALPFEYISLILLAAMVGAIVIGKVKK